MAKTLLKGKVRDQFMMHATELEALEEGEEDWEAVFRGALELTGSQFFPTQYPWRRQRHYLRYGLKLKDMTLQKFKSRLQELNSFLRYFPLPEGMEGSPVLSEDELLEIVDRAKPDVWQRNLYTANIDPYGMSLNEYCLYLEKLEAKGNLDRQMHKDKQKKETESNLSGNSKRKYNPNGNTNKNKEKNSNSCGNCGKPGHATKDCWHLEENKHKRPAKKQRPTQSAHAFTADQVENLFAALTKIANKDTPKKSKRQMELENFFASDTESVNTNTTSESYQNSYVVQANSKNSSDCSSSTKDNKRQKTSQLTTEVIAEISNKKGQTWLLCVLLDTGTTSSIIPKDLSILNSYLSIRV